MPSTYRLFDARLVVSRSLAYGTLTACVVATYLLVSGLVHIQVAIRFDHQRHIELRVVGDPADHARVALDAHPPPALELVE
ncbi:MAG TPA: hypothetical protein VHN80_10005 [Kineosporiaceae bacterium]|nr:hypothetical protein [Kineosporiaceae bacterium]